MISFYVTKKTVVKLTAHLSFIFWNPIQCVVQEEKMVWMWNDIPVAELDLQEWKQTPDNVARFLSLGEEMIQDEPGLCLEEVIKIANQRCRFITMEEMQTVWLNRAPPIRFKLKRKKHSLPADSMLYNIADLYQKTSHLEIQNTLVKMFGISANLWLDMDRRRSQMRVFTLVRA